MDIGGACTNCGYDGVTGSFAKRGSEIVSCDKCKSFKSASYRDADGNEISMPNSMIGKYSHATGTVWESKRELSNFCKKNNLVQTGQVLKKDK